MHDPEDSDMVLAAPMPRPDRLLPSAWLPGGSYTGILEVQPRSLASGKMGDRSGERAAARGATHPAEAAVLGRVLVVDDEALVRRMLSLFLTRAGFAVVAVESGAEALDMLRATGEACDLLVTDQSMPGMTGCELIGAARDLRPDLPVLLVSGYDMSGGTERLPSHVPLLRKPVERAAFLGRVHQMLGLAGNKDGPGI